MTAQETAQQERLIAEYIEADLDHGNAGDARLKAFGVSVWALVGYYLISHGDLVGVAEDYCVPREAVLAALAYYERHKSEIDARIADAA